MHETPPDRGDRLAELGRRAARLAVGALPARARRAVRMRRRDATASVIAWERLDATLEQAAERFARSEDEGRAFLSRCRAVPPPPPPDPFSDTYREWVWALYARASGRSSYALAHETSPFDFDGALRRPYPYSTGSATLVGDDLIARGAAVRALAVPAPARVVEFGPGWGNLTGELVHMGHEVTAVDVDDQFCRLIGKRVPAARVVCADMLTFAAERQGAPYDAAVFFESFHHCADHLRLLELLHGVVRPGGLLLLAGEPVDLLAYPWGPRLDGLSLWSMRRHGWLELGFDEGYFAEALRRTGWRARRLAGTTASSTVYVATAAGGAPAQRG